MENPHYSRSWPLELLAGLCWLATSMTAPAQVANPPVVAVRYYCCESHPRAPLTGIRDRAEQILAKLQTFNVVTLDPESRPGLVLDMETASFDQKNNLWQSHLNSQPEEQKILQLFIYTGHGFMTPQAGSTWQTYLAFRDGYPNSLVWGKPAAEIIHAMNHQATERRPCVFISDSCRDPYPAYVPMHNLEAFPQAASNVRFYFTTPFGRRAGANVFQDALLHVLDQINEKISMGEMLGRVRTVMRQRTGGDQTLSSPHGHDLDEYSIPFFLEPKTPDPAQLSYTSAAALEQPYVLPQANAHDLGTPDIWVAASAPIAVSDHFSRYDARALPPSLDLPQPLTRFEFPAAGFSTTCEFRSGQLPGDNCIIVEKSAGKSVRTRFYDRAKSMVLDKHLFLDKDTTLEFRDLTIKKGVRFVTNGYSLNVRVLGSLKAEDFEIVSFETPSAADGLAGKPGEAGAPGGGGGNGFNGLSAGASSLIVLGDVAKGTLSVRMPGMSGGAGGAGGKGGSGIDVDIGPGGTGFPGGAGGDGGAGGTGGVLSITLPPGARETFVVQTSVVDGGLAGAGGQAGKGGDPGKGEVGGQPGGAGLEGRPGKTGQAGKIVIGYGRASPDP